MITLVLCLRRIATLSPEEFQEYWRTTHKRLVLERARVLRFQRYSQLHTVEIPELSGLAAARGSPEGYDGIAEACFGAVEDLLITRRDPAASRAARELIEDERKFIDHSRSPIFLVDRESVLI
jgi:hypothetical protein